MGGRGSGGARPGAGRKSKRLDEKVDEFEAPDDLATDERLVWLELAPHAFQAGTLTRGTSYAFRLLCRNIILERGIAKDVEQRGGANHRGIIQRIDAELQAFSLRPMGKPLIEEAPKVVDPFAELDATVN